MADGIFTGYDSEGRLLEIFLTDPTKPLYGRDINITIKDAEKVPSHQGELICVLRHFLKSVQKKPVSDKQVDAMSLAELVDEALKYKTD
ncbi:hypothetical protein STSP2_00744 [Anaerohalosphaera lusitana]|uniref:Uncharacterized protein n=1 Tax=Anaerohalosphaera lusitana TaxID=1936003 RepID=A0A1U9NJA0_9BACT|nr:hypothetical protein STSP2_00744 [Anaerohalosphaera lusitana]